MLALIVRRVKNAPDDFTTAETKPLILKKLERTSEQ